MIKTLSPIEKRNLSRVAFFLFIPLTAYLFFVASYCYENLDRSFGGYAVLSIVSLMMLGSSRAVVFFAKQGFPETHAKMLAEKAAKAQADAAKAQAEADKAKPAAIP